MTGQMIKALMAGAALIALAGGPVAAQQAPAVDPAAPVPDAIGMKVAEGFEATVVHEGVGRARHLVVADDGRIYVRLRDATEGKGVAALQDQDGDGVAETVEYFDDTTGTGIAIHDGHLYISSTTAVFRYPLEEGELVPSGERETVVEGFPEQDSHAEKAFAIDDDGMLYVNVGAPSNACQEQTRTAGSPGMDPCPLLEEHAGIWRFDASRAGQSPADGERVVTGARNVVAIDYDPASDSVYLVQHGRDQLHEFWPDLFTVEESAELPGEELHRVHEGANLGWPYTYWDWQEEARMVAPEYGGDGQTEAEAGAYQEPLVAFPGHWAPNGLLFVEDGPEALAGGALIAFHGSWNRAPRPQAGYKVVFVPFADGEVTGEWTVFADGFAGEEDLAVPDAARFRPMGLAEGPDGSLLIADSVKGRIWRVAPAG